MPSLLVAGKLIVGGRGLAPAVLRRAATMALDWDTRQRSRFEATDASGRRIGVFLPRGIAVRGGDVLVAEDGSLVVVHALAQPILVATARATSAHPALDLLRAAYHLGNRHVALALEVERLVLEPDHVLAELLERMGLDVASASGPFEPESGAYDGRASGGAHVHAAEVHPSHPHAHGQAHANAPLHPGRP